MQEAAGMQGQCSRERWRLGTQHRACDLTEGQLCDRGPDKTDDLSFQSEKELRGRGASCRQQYHGTQRESTGEGGRAPADEQLTHRASQAGRCPDTLLLKTSLCVRRQFGDLVRKCERSR